VRGNYPSSSLIKSYTNMLANADDGSLTTKDKSLPLSDNFSYCFISEDICKQNSIVQKISEYCDLHSYLWLFLSKQRSRLSFNLLRGVLVWKNSAAITFTNSKLNVELSLVDLGPVCWLARLLVGGKPSATQNVTLTYTFMLLLLQLKYYYMNCFTLSLTLRS
jgi:hypothetical protein